MVLLEECLGRTIKCDPTKMNLKFSELGLITKMTQGFNNDKNHVKFKSPDTLLKDIVQK